MFKLARTAQFFLFGGLMIPLQTYTPQWHSFQYSGVNSNSVAFSKEGLTIQVHNSASPLFYQLGETLKVKTVKVHGSLTGIPQMSSISPEKEDGDDLPFRLGFVESSAKEPGWFQRLLLPQWIKDLLTLFPGRGLRKVTFLTVSKENPPGTSRLHPKSELLEEIVALKQNKPGPFAFTYDFSNPISAEALWIQPDGDDTHSTYSMTLNHLEFETVGD